MGTTSTSNTVPQMPGWVWDALQENANAAMALKNTPYQSYPYQRFLDLNQDPLYQQALQGLQQSPQEAQANKYFQNQYANYTKNLGGNLNKAIAQGQNRFINPGLQDVNQGERMIGNAAKYLNTGDDYLTRAGKVTNKGVQATNQAGNTFDRAQKISNMGVNTIGDASKYFNHANRLYNQGASTIGQASPLFSQAQDMTNKGASVIDTASPIYQQALGLMNKGDQTIDLANPYYGLSSGLLEDAKRLSPLVQSQIDTGNKYLQTGMDTTGLAQGANAAATNLLTGPGTSAQALYDLAARGKLMEGAMNPYVNDVVDATATLANRNFKQNVLPTLQRSFVGGGGFGSSRNQNAAALAGSNMQQDLTAQQAQLLQSGWNNQMQNMLSAAGGMGQTAGQMTDVGSLYNAIANSQIGAGQAAYQGAGTTQGLMGALGNLSSGYRDLIANRIAQGAEYGNLGSAVRGVGDSTVNQGLGYGQLGSVLSGIGSDIVNQGLGYGQLGQGETQLGSAKVNQGLGYETAADTMRGIGMGRLSQADTYGNLGNDLTNIANSYGNYAQTKGNLGSNLADVGMNRMQNATLPMSLQSAASQNWTQALANLTGMQSQRLAGQQALGQEAWNQIGYNQQNLDWNYNQFLEGRDWDRNMLAWANGLVNPISAQTTGQKSTSNDGGAMAAGIGTSVASAAAIAAIAL